MNSIQIRFGLVCALALIAGGTWLGVSGFADWGLFAVGMILALVSGVSWWRERGPTLATVPVENAPLKGGQQIA